MKGGVSDAEEDYEENIVIVDTLRLKRPNWEREKEMRMRREVVTKALKGGYKNLRGEDKVDKKREKMKEN